MDNWDIDTLGATRKDGLATVGFEYDAWRAMYLHTPVQHIGTFSSKQDAIHYLDHLYPIEEENHE